MRVCGLDAGSEKFGYGVIRAEGDLLSYVEAGVLTAPGGWNKYRRLAEIGRDLEAVLDELKPDVAVLEAGFVFGQMGALTLGAARGVGGYLAARRGLEVFEYAPTTIKKAVTGSGKATKEQVARAVQLTLMMTRAPAPDAGDALAAAITHARQLVATARKARAA